MREFSRIKRLPPYVLGIVNDLKYEARRRGEDIIDFGLGNPDMPTPTHIVDKLIESAQKRPIIVTPCRKVFLNFDLRYAIGTSAIMMSTWTQTQRPLQLLVQKRASLILLWL